MSSANKRMDDYQPPVDTGLDVLFVDETLLVVDKPSGLLSVPGRGEHKQDCLITRVQREYADALIVHRLDMETSGLLMLARGKEAHRHLSALFQKRAVQKQYIAVVDGVLKKCSGVIDLPLICDWPNRPRQKVDHELGKPSRTLFTVLGPGLDAQSTRVELLPETGRSHQLRVHMQALGHPILGDRLYADAAAQARSAYLLLHAQTLGFIHPSTGEQLSITCKAPF
jgi:tRNA pseudouridine32 synthase/23S rRNA pseudouridine746 synthase